MEGHLLSLLAWPAPICILTLAVLFGLTGFPEQLEVLVQVVNLWAVLLELELPRVLLLPVLKGSLVNIEWLLIQGPPYSFDLVVVAHASVS